jgi:hypothetical protein
MRDKLIIVPDLIKNLWKSVFVVLMRNPFNIEVVILILLVINEYKIKQTVFNFILQIIHLLFILGIITTISLNYLVYKSFFIIELRWKVEFVELILKLNIYILQKVEYYY